MNKTITLNLIHFLTEETNFKLLCFMLEQHEVVSLQEIAKGLEVPRTTARRHVTWFVERFLIGVAVATPRTENDIISCYKTRYMLHPKLKNAMNNFVDMMITPIERQVKKIETN